ncbi:MAG: DUF624 domain-containing protein [Ruminococcaceae bacterium]|nr:DUF624 domain-containing protein [Oscillospiraceae bacterium]
MKETKLSRALGWVIDLLCSAALWIVSSLPLFTIGAASAALYYAVVKCIRHERGTLWSTYWEGFRANFKRGALMWLIYLAALAVGAANVTAARQLGGGGALVALAGVIFVPVVLTLPWMFAYLSRFENSLAGSLKFVGYLAVSHPGRTLLLAAELLFALLLAWLLPQVGAFTPGAITLLMSLAIEPVFREYTGDDNAEDARDAWYNEE